MEASRQFLKLKYILHLWHTLDLHILTWCMSRPIYVLRKVKSLWLSAYTEIHFNCLHSESSQNFMDLKNKFRNSGAICLQQQWKMFLKSITGYPVIFPRYKEVAIVFLPQCDWAIKVTEKWAFLTWNVSSALEESIRGVGHSKHFVVTAVRKVFQSC